MLLKIFLAEFGERTGAPLRSLFRLWIATANHLKHQLGGNAPRFGKAKGIDSSNVIPPRTIVEAIQQHIAAMAGRLYPQGQAPLQRIPY
jgi:hypothetical protein